MHSLIFSLPPPSLLPPLPSCCRKVQEALAPSTLSITNDSSKHAGHSGNPSGAPDAETHFTLTVVSDAFAGKSLVQRHRMIYGLLKEELDAGLHALALKTKAPGEPGS